MLTKLLDFARRGISAQSEVDRIMAELRDQRYPNIAPIPMREHLAALPVPDPDPDEDDHEPWDDEE